MLLIFDLLFHQAVPIQLNGVVPKDGTWHSGTNQFIVSKVAGKKLSAKVINTDKYTAVLDVTVPGESKTLNQVSNRSHGAFTCSVLHLVRYKNIFAVYSKWCANVANDNYISWLFGCKDLIWL